jgi:hypothetical protein
VDDYSTRIPEFLESATDRVRSLTVDRAAKILTFAALGLVILTLAVFALIFLLVGILRILGELTFKICDCTSYMEIAYAILGGLFLVAGAFLWARRKSTPGEEAIDE